MEFIYYKENGDKREELRTDKFSVLQKQEHIFEPVAFDEDDYEDYITYVIYTFKSKDADTFVRHSNLVDFLKEYYNCDLVADAYYVSDMGDSYYSWNTHGFFIVINDKIEEFITREYASGLYDCAHKKNYFVGGTK